MKIKGLRDEDFTQYKKPSMFIVFPTCTFKCCKENNLPIEICQNCELARASNVNVSVQKIIDRYISNPITTSVVMGGLEPIDSWSEVQQFIIEFRNYTNDDCVIYTGYYPEEIQDKIKWLKRFPNIVIKYGRFIPNQQPHFDEVLGVFLASDNQYARRIS